MLTFTAGGIGFTDHRAVTPAGNQLICKLIGPLNDPPVTAVKLTVPELPCATATELDAALSVSVGCISVTPPPSQSLTSNAPSTDPRPVARLYSPLAVNPVTPGTLLFPDGVA